MDQRRVTSMQDRMHALARRLRVTSASGAENGVTVSADNDVDLITE